MRLTTLVPTIPFIGIRGILRKPARPPPLAKATPLWHDCRSEEVRLQFTKCHDVLNGAWYSVHGRLSKLKLPSSGKEWLC